MELTKENMIGLGVAGNFAGHLEQAGEAESFSHVKVKESKAPKAIFPFYVPGHKGFLSVWPLSDDTIVFPEEGDNLQIEPEVAIICKINYNENKSAVTGLTPLMFAAYNDCSIRNPNAKKISEKKNWGVKTKGLSSQRLPIDSFSPEGVLNRYRIASFLQRDSETFEYGIDSPVSGYSYNHATLIDWIVEKIARQTDEDPTEPIFPLIAASGHPEFTLISIGATRYTPFGESTFLQAGDTSIVVVYDGTAYTPDQINNMVKENQLRQNEQRDGISLLIQNVV